MKPWITALVVSGVLGAYTAASAQWTYVAPAAVPAPAVYSYWPAAPIAPVYVYRPAAVTVYRPAAVAVYRPAPVTVYRPAVVSVPAVPAPVVSEPGVAPVVYPAPIGYPGTVVIRAKVYYPGQPVRNVVRAVLP